MQENTANCYILIEKWKQKGEFNFFFCEFKGDIQKYKKGTLSHLLTLTALQGDSQFWWSK